MRNLITKIKESINEGIEQEQLIMTKKYEKDKARVAKIDNVPDLIKELVNIYGNTIQQKEKMISVLNEYLEADFFKNAEILKKANSVRFENKKHFVDFSTSGLHVITIGAVEYLREPIQPLPLKEDVLKFNEMWINYKKTGENYSDVLDKYSMLTRKLPAGALFKMKTKKKHVEAFANKQKKLIQENIEKMKLWESKMKEYKEHNDLTFNVIKDIKEDLIKFKNKNWHMKYKNIIDSEEFKI